MKKFFNYFSNIAVNCFRNVIFQYFPTFGLPEDYRMVSRIWIRLAGQEDIVVLRNSPYSRVHICSLKDSRGLS